MQGSKEEGERFEKHEWTQILEVKSDYTDFTWK